MTIAFSASSRRLRLLALAVFLPGAPVFCATFTANPSLDAFVATGPGGSLANNNYGGGGSLSVAAAGLPQGEFQSVLQFSLAPALSAFNAEFGAGQWAIQSVSLQLTAAAGGNAIFNSPQAGSFGISWLQNDSWLEGSGTPNAPGASGITYTSLQNTVMGPGDENLGSFSFSGGTSGSSVYALGLAPGFAGDLLAGGNVSLRLSAADSGVSAVFNSRSFGTVANRPLLTVQAQAVPEPGVAALAGLGFAFTAWQFCRRASR